VLDDLRKHAEGLADAVAAASAREQATKERIVKLNADLDKLRAENRRLQALSITIDDLNREAAEAKAAYESQLGEFRRAADEERATAEERLRREREAGAAAIRSAREERSRLEERLRGEYEAALAAAEASANRIQAEREAQFEARLVEAQAAQEAAERRVEAAEKADEAARRRLKKALAEAKGEPEKALQRYRKEAEHDIENHRAESLRLQEQLDGALVKNTALETELSLAQERIKDVETAEQQLRRKWSEAQKEARENWEALTEARARQVEAVEARQEAEAERNQIRNRAGKSAVEIAAAQAELERQIAMLTSKLALAQSAAEAAIERANVAERTVGELQSALATQEKQLKSANRERARLGTRLRNEGASHRALRRDLTETQSQLSEIAEMQGRLTKAENQLAEERTRAFGLGRQLADARSQLLEEQTQHESDLTDQRRMTLLYQDIQQAYAAEHSQHVVSRKRIKDLEAKAERVEEELAQERVARQNAQQELADERERQQRAQKLTI
jgi:chromosome segregation ATPase